MRLASIHPTGIAAHVESGSEVHRQLNPFHRLMETTDLHIDDFKPRVRDHRERPWLTEQSCTPMPVVTTLNMPFPYSRMCDILE